MLPLISLAGRAWIGFQGGSVGDPVYLHCKVDLSMEYDSFKIFRNSLLVNDTEPNLLNFESPGRSFSKILSSFIALCSKNACFRCARSHGQQSHHSHVPRKIRFHHRDPIDNRSRSGAMWSWGVQMFCGEKCAVYPWLVAKSIPRPDNSASK